MKLKVITLTNQPNNPGFLQLKRSLQKHRYDFHVIESQWRGFGTKIILTAEYARTIAEEYTHILFCDAHDTFFLGPETEILEKTYSRRFGWISAEKACWPDPQRADQYHSPNKSEWRYVNSGLYLMPIPMFLQIVEENPIEWLDDDQRWLTSVYLSGKYNLMLDMNCKLFQSIAFQADTDFRITSDRRLYNMKQHSTPIAAHGNGKTAMEWVYNLIP